MKTRHIPAVMAHEPLFVLRNWWKMLAHTFRGTSIKSLLGLESDQRVFQAIETCAAGSGCTCSFLECHPERRAQTESQQAPGLCLLGCWSEESRDPYFPGNPNLVAVTGGHA